jgi:cell division protein FtsQ
LVSLRRSRNSPKPARQRPAGDGIWERPLLINLLADLLFIAAAAGLSYAAATAVQRLPVFPLRQLVLVQPLHEVAQSQIEHAARTALTGNFFTVNLETVRDAFQQLPWVRRANVRRLWPDGIEVAIEEHVAAARWRPGDESPRLVNSYGEVFVADAIPAQLPILSGPDGAAPLLLSQYREFTQTLAPLGRRPLALAMTPRRALQLRLDDGLVLELGRDQSKDTLSERLSRFVTAYGEVRGRLAADPDRVDLRYPNGFALHLPRKAAQKS